MLTQTAPISSTETESTCDGRGSDRIEYAPVCAQCKFFDVTRNMCEGKLVAWEHDRSVVVRPLANATDKTCSDRYVEFLPF
ncbi:MAG: hypothetical protein DCF22_00645 [Leptolyngbya sp.]|nr:MAG: hypothetical protein DCF22_00645 [Leptolyngbya sp.]